MTKLKRSHDKGSPCLKTRAVSKDSKRSIPTWTELQELLNVILYGLIIFAVIPSSDIAAKNMIPYRAIEGSLIVDKKMVCVNLCFMGLLQDLA